MFSRNGPPQQPNLDKATDQSARTDKKSYIAADVSIKGDLSCAADLQFDGAITGDLDCRNLSAGQGAKIEGTVRVNNLTLYGAISGLVEAESVHLGNHAQMLGDIVYSSLAIDEGATFEGNLRRRSPSTDKVTVLHRPR